MTLREQAIENLLGIDRIFKELRINYFLMDGTLLGLYRDGDLIAGDYDDIDVGLTSKDWCRVEEFVEEAKKQGFAVFKRFILKGTLEGISIKRWANHIDIFLVHKNKETGEAFNLGRNCCKVGSLDYMAYVYPLECFEKFNALNFEGEQFVIPSETEKFLEARYNENWKTPFRRGEGFDFKDLKENKAIRGDYKF